MGRHHDDDGDGVADQGQLVQEPPEQDDLTADDHLVQNTEKHAPGDPDAELPSPPQDPSYVPESAVDEHGEPLR